jgi:hypothetical protein
VNNDKHTPHDSSNWTFSADGLICETNNARSEAVAKEQHALRVMQSADTTFATAITARLVPDRGTNLDIIRRVVP